MARSAAAAAPLFACSALLGVAHCQLTVRCRLSAACFASGEAEDEADRIPWLAAAPASVDEAQPILFRAAVQQDPPNASDRGRRRQPCGAALCPAMLRALNLP
jgi:hypothetical protein